MRLSYIPLIFFLMTGILKADTDFRIRILERYYPREIVISYPESIYEEIKIDKSSKFPVIFNDRTTYTIKIPSINFKRKYNGRITILKGDELIVINSVSQQNYITSVVLAEFGLKSPEAMCAQAVISRTWAYSHLNPNQKWDFNDLTISQVYKGATTYDKRVSKIISQTDNEVLKVEEKFAEIFFYAKCSDLIYSPYEIWGRRIPYIKRGSSGTIKPYEWETKIEEKILKKLFSVSDFNPLRVRLNGQHFVKVNDSLYPIDSFRLKINRKLGWAKLKSTDFKISKFDGNIVFKGKGHGHLVGFCQEGAEKLSQKGYTYREILSFYYPGASISNP